MEHSWNGQDWALLITSIGALITTLTSAAAAIIGLMARNRSVRNSVAIEEVRVATNGLKAELVATTARAAQAEGEIKGRMDVKDEVASGKLILPTPNGNGHGKT